MDNLFDIKYIFFEALKYPEFARSNFYVQKQKESSWSKGVFFTALNEIYHDHIKILEFKYSVQKKGKEYFGIEDTKLRLGDLLKTEDDTILNKEDLDSLFYSIQRAIRFDKEKKNYDPFEILSFAEVGVLFIKREFYEQTKKTSSPGFRPRTETYFIYLLAQDAPFFDFPKFKNAIRQLLYTSHNLKKVENLLTALHKTCVEIVDLWNKQLHSIVQKSVRHEIARVEFKAETLKNSWWSDEKMFDACVPHNLYLNQDFASHAANIANLINSEVIHGKEIHLEKDKKDFLKDLLRGIETLSEFDFTDFASGSNNESRQLEKPYRDYFFKWFRNLDYGGERESLKGGNFIDLKVIEDSNKKNIVEFKGWWNSGKKSIILQMFNYLSQFEGVGYIFMINQTKTNIREQYFNLVAKDENGYIKNSWEEISYKSTAFQYYKSQHDLDGQNKVIYHFIFDLPIFRKVHKKNSTILHK